MGWKAKWIIPRFEREVCPTYKRYFKTEKPVVSATLKITAVGVYEATLNGQRISDYVLAPGWTSYSTRHQYQIYDVTDMLNNNNCLQVTVARGWYRSDMSGGSKDHRGFYGYPQTMIAELDISYADGSTETIVSDKEWKIKSSPVIFSTIYDGEWYDATKESYEDDNAGGEENVIELPDFPTDNLIPQEGEIITEHERIKPIELIITPKGERVIDFGQNLTGYIEFTVDANEGDKISVSHAEVLDNNGNFYNDNFVYARAKLDYVCKQGVQTYKPSFTFFGFRYIRLDEFPGEIDINNFTAIAVYSDMKRTGHFECSNPLLNKFYENVIWSQKGNFLDVPMDCPQRSERLGWTGDAQVFARAATYNFDTSKFYRKWLRDMAADQGDNGYIPFVIPTRNTPEHTCGAGWSDTAVILPWEVYMTYGDKEALKEQLPMMKKWISYITTHTTEQYLWTGGEHFGDWLDLEAPDGSYKGATDHDLLASAFYAYSTSLVAKACKAVGEDASEFEELHANIVKAFKARFNSFKTQTEHVLALHFGLTDEPEKVAASLAKLIADNGYALKTGFMGTPYLLHALSDNGYADIAYTLVLRENYPSWLYPVTKGATTVWEHWDGIKPDGSFWSKDMNSFNHYSYGSMTDWLYGTAAGIRRVEENAGFEKIVIAPHPDKRLDYLEASIETKYGTVRSRWEYVDGNVRYEIDTPSPATVVIDGEERQVEKGSYVF